MAATQTNRCSKCGTARPVSGKCVRCAQIKHRFPCSLCPRKFAFRSRLKQHMLTHDPAASQPVPCPAIGCPSAFRRRADAIMHFRAKHLALFKCADCGHTALSPRKLEIHRRIHTQERPFRCGVCPSAFIRKAHLDAHKFVHTDTVPPHRACVQCLDTNKATATTINVRNSICLRHRLCTTHAVQRGLIAPARRSPGSLAACRCFDEIERIAGIKIDHIHYSHDDRSFAGTEVQGLIPGKRFAPDGIDHHSRTHIYEFLGTPWHGFPDPNAPGKSHTGKEYWQLHAQTMARIHLFADHGFVVHYVWQSQWDRAATARDKLACIHVAR